MPDISIFMRRSGSPDVNSIALTESAAPPPVKPWPPIVRLPTPVHNRVTGSVSTVMRFCIQFAIFRPAFVYVTSIQSSTHGPPKSGVQPPPAPSSPGILARHVTFSQTTACPAAGAGGTAGGSTVNCEPW